MFAQAEKKKEGVNTSERGTNSGYDWTFINESPVHVQGTTYKTVHFLLLLKDSIGLVERERNII